MKVIIHVGMPKTGSSAIQQSLRKAPSSDSHYFCDMGGGNSSKLLSTLFLDNPLEYLLRRPHRLGGDSLRRLRKKSNEKLECEFSNALGKTLIISGEGLIMFTQTELRRMLSHFKTLGADDFEIIGYVRPPKGFIVSSFQQNIKQKKRRFPGNIPRYRRIFEPQFAMKSDCAVQILKYDPKSFDKNDIVLDFCSRIGYRFDPKHSIRSNEGLSLPAVKLLYIYRMYGFGIELDKKTARSNRRLVDTLRKIKGSKFHIHSSVTDPIISSQSHEIQWMEDKLGCSLTDDQPERSGGVISEADLLNIDTVILNSFTELLESYETPIESVLTSNDPFGIAEAIERLRLVLDESVSEHNTQHQPSSYGKQSNTVINRKKRNNTVMKPKELVQRAKVVDPTLKGIPDRLAISLLNSVYSEILKEINGTDEGRIKVPKLGAFFVKKVNKEVGGETVSRSRVLFRPVDPDRARSSKGDRPDAPA